jgi:hypothetical protein
MLSVLGWLLVASAVLCGCLQTATALKLRFGLRGMELREKGRLVAKSLWLYAAALSLMLVGVLFLAVAHQT